MVTLAELVATLMLEQVSKPLHDYLLANGEAIIRPEAESAQIDSEAGNHVSEIAAANVRNGWKADIATKGVQGYTAIVGYRAQKLRGWTEGQRNLIGRFAFEFVIVVVGVTAAFALENARQDREETQYRVQMVSALRESLDDYAGHGVEVQRHIDGLLREFDLARQQKLQPTPPVYRESGGERPPTRAWDAIAESGAARALDPKLFFRLARFHGRADSIGDRYIRYNDFSEQRVLPYASEPETFYDDRGRLKPEYAGYVDRLRDLQREHIALLIEAGKLRDALR